MKKYDVTKKDTDNHSEYWWLRSSYSADSHYSSYVSGFGYVNGYHCLSRIGIAPHFMI